MWNGWAIVGTEVSSLEKKVADEPFGSWVIIEHKIGRGCVTSINRSEGAGGGSTGSRFSALMNMEGGDIGGDSEILKEGRKFSDVTLIA